ncbi:hypothetical protein RKD51_000964 [Bacillus sp. SLBN-57]
MASNASLYFVAIPKRPTSHIQNKAPGPPTVIAVATPAIFPFPIVPASVVISALKLLTSPSAPADSFSFPNASLNAYINLLN